VKNIGHAKGAGGMTGFRLEEAPDDAPEDGVRHQFQVFHIRL